MFASDAIYQARIATCRSCEHFRKSLQQCKVCMCIMVIKARLSSQSCPIGKWVAVKK